MSRTVAEFVSENSSLFTVMGVFGAISVYLTQIEVESRWQRLGVASSLTLFVLIGLSIGRQIPPDDSDKNSFDYLTAEPSGKFRITVFYVCLLALIVSIGGVIASYAGTITFILFLFCVIISVSAVVQASGKVVDPGLDGEVIGRPDTDVNLIKRMILFSICFTILGGIAITLSWFSNMLDIASLLQFRLSSAFAAVFVGLAVGTTVGGLLYLLIMSTLYALHRTIRYIGMERWREFAENSQYSTVETEDESS